MITDEQLNKWETLHKAAMPGAWETLEASSNRLYVQRVGDFGPALFIVMKLSLVGDSITSAATNAEFVVEAHNTIVPALIDEVRRLRQALETIHRDGGKVCENYELCDHPACQSSHMAWSVADALLSEESQLAEDTALRVVETKRERAQKEGETR